MKKEREILVEDINNTFDTLLKELSKFGTESLNEVPFEGSWTAGQAAEHIIICCSGIPDNRTTKVNRVYSEKVGPIKELFLNSDLKFKADPSIAPDPPPHNKEALLNNLTEIKEHLITVADTTDLKALCEDMELPTFGLLTRYEWLRFILFHTQRHTHQIGNIGKHVN